MSYAAGIIITFLLGIIFNIFAPGIGSILAGIVGGYVAHRGVKGGFLTGLLGGLLGAIIAYLFITSILLVIFGIGGFILGSIIGFGIFGVSIIGALLSGLGGIIGGYIAGEEKF